MRTFDAIQRALIQFVTDYHTIKVPFQSADHGDDAVAISAADATPVDDLMSQPSEARTTALEHLINEATETVAEDDGAPAQYNPDRPLLLYLVRVGLPLLDTAKTLTPENRQDLQTSSAAIHLFMSNLTGLFHAESIEVTVPGGENLTLTGVSEEDFPGTPRLLWSFLQNLGIYTDQTDNRIADKVELLHLRHTDVQLRHTCAALHAADASPYKTATIRPPRPGERHRLFNIMAAQAKEAQEAQSPPITAQPIPLAEGEGSVDVHGDGCGL